MIGLAISVVVMVVIVVLVIVERWSKKLASCTNDRLKHRAILAARALVVPDHAATANREANAGEGRELQATGRVGDRMSVRRMARRLGVSDRTLYARCVRYLGIGPKAYITERRLQLVRELLCTGDWTVTQAAVECGFTQLGWFSRIYRQRFGEVPIETLRAAQGRAPLLWPMRADAVLPADVRRASPAS